MNYRAFIKHDGKDDASAWSEDYSYSYIETLGEAEQQARRFVDDFNASLRPGEKRRVFVRVEEIAEEVNLDERHEWRKTNLMTLASPHGRHDTMKCEVCGITGKRYGISESVTLDSQYRAKAFTHCDTARALLAKRKEKQEQEN